MGLSRDDRDGLDKSLKDLNLSHDVRLGTVRSSSTRLVAHCHRVVCSSYPCQLTCLAMHGVPKAKHLCTALAMHLQELDKFSKAFKDPEFLKLFEEYAKEVSDPKVRCQRPPSFARHKLLHLMHTGLLCLRWVTRAARDVQWQPLQTVSHPCAPFSRPTKDVWMRDIWRQ